MDCNQRVSAYKLLRSRIVDAIQARVEDRAMQGSSLFSVLKTLLVGIVIPILFMALSATLIVVITMLRFLSSLLALPFILLYGYLDGLIVGLWLTCKLFKRCYGEQK